MSMTMTMEKPQTETKWRAENLGPRQAKQFNEALSAFGWEAKTTGEITDYSDGKPSFHTLMVGGSPSSLASELMDGIRTKYDMLVTGDNYKAIVADLEAATARHAKEGRPVVDRRSTPEERAERDAARKEREEKERVEAARIASMQTHYYDTPEAAKALKHVLAVIWPSVKFSVTSDRYSGGYSITSAWTDGPTGDQVRKIITWFKNKSFDGMQDLESTTDPSEWNGHRFDIRGGYGHGSRSVSAELLQRCLIRFTNETGFPGPTINTSDSRNPYLERGDTSRRCPWSLFPHDEEHPEGTLSHDEASHWSAADLVGQMSHYLATVEPLYPLTRETVFKILLGEIGKPEAPAAESVAIQAGDGITISENEERDGVESASPRSRTNQYGPGSKSTASAGAGSLPAGITNARRQRSRSRKAC